MVADVSVEDLFTEPVLSPYMNFAAPLTDVACKAFPAICHYDQTARPQTVTATDDMWLHSLLLAMKKRIGAAVLCNTSFNTHGKPIINSMREALRLLRDEPDLDYVLLDGWLFEADRLVDADDALLESLMGIMASTNHSSLTAPRSW